MALGEESSESDEYTWGGGLVEERPLAALSFGFSDSAGSGGLFFVDGGALPFFLGVGFFSESEDACPLLLTLVELFSESELLLSVPEEEVEEDVDEEELEDDSELEAASCFFLSAISLVDSRWRGLETKDTSSRSHPGRGVHGFYEK